MQIHLKILNYHDFQPALSLALVAEKHCFVFVGQYTDISWQRNHPYNRTGKHKGRHYPITVSDWKNFPYSYRTEMALQLEPLYL